LGEQPSLSICTTFVSSIVALYPVTSVIAKVLIWIWLHFLICARAWVLARKSRRIRFVGLGLHFEHTAMIPPLCDCSFLYGLLGVGVQDGSAHSHFHFYHSGFQVALPVALCSFWSGLGKARAHGRCKQGSVCTLGASSGSWTFFFGIPHCTQDTALSILVVHGLGRVTLEGTCVFCCMAANCLEYPVSSPWTMFGFRFIYTVDAHRRLRGILELGATLSLQQSCKHISVSFSRLLPVLLIALVPCQDTLPYSTNKSLCLETLTRLGACHF
jgi:hypothetical protein